MVVKRGKMTRPEGAELAEGLITDIKDSFKCLVVSQAHGSHDEEARQVLKCQLNGENKLQAISVLSVPCRSSDKDVAEEQVEEVLWQANPLHRMYHRQKTEVDYIRKILPVAGKTKG